ncbi:MAG: phytanoyl-CoA dioxygenase family protein [Opitutaceae bacterium]|nr:phytanoyl-CoA dioxygenase family protein [Opitutaceae bacterium]
MKTHQTLEALRQSYEADGFVIIRGLLDASEFAELQANLDRYVRDVVPTLPKDQAFFDDYSKPETLRKMQSINKHDAWFSNFMQNGKHVAIQEYLMRDKCDPQGLEWFNKLPYDQNATPAHQDGFYWCRKPNLASGIWIALEEVDIANGCLWYARGSHRHGIQPHGASGVLGFSQGLLNFDPAKADGVPIELHPGDAVAHSSATVHWSGVNNTARTRRALATFCYGASTVRDEEAFARYKASLAAQLAKRGIESTVK